MDYINLRYGHNIFYIFFLENLVWGKHIYIIVLHVYMLRHGQSIFYNFGIRKFGNGQNTF